MKRDFQKQNGEKQSIMQSMKKIQQIIRKIPVQYLQVGGLLCFLIMIISIGVSSNTNYKEENSDRKEEVRQELYSIKISDAIDLQIQPSRLYEENKPVDTTISICAADLQIAIPERFFEQDQFEKQYAHVAEYISSQGKSYPKERAGIKNEQCHFNVLIVGNLEETDLEDLLSMQEEQYQEELLKQVGLSIEDSAYSFFDQSNSEAKYVIEYVDEATEFHKYYERYTQKEGKYTVFISVGIKNATEEEEQQMKTIVDHISSKVLLLEEMEKKAENNMIAQYYCGRCYNFGYGVEKDTEKGFQYLFKAAEAGNASSQNYIGYAYLNGNGVEQDITEAIKWFQKAAENGNGEAMNNLGNRYFSGEGVEQDAKKAVEWYEKAIEAGNATAYYNLANRYRYGDGVDQSKEKAIQLYESAAELGVVQAYTRLGNMYLEGEGITKDKEKALDNFKKAAILGDEDAISILKQLE